MGLGRRAFIQSMSAALAGITFDPLQAVITSQDWYVNRKFGLMCRKPADWTFVHVTDFGRLKEGQILTDEYEEMRKEGHQVLADPLVLMTRYDPDDPQFKGRFSPTITVHAAHRSQVTGMWGIDTFEDSIRWGGREARNMLKEFQTTQTFEQIGLCGCNSYEHRATYLFEHEEAQQPVTVELRIIHIEHGDLFYDINMHQSSQSNELAGDLFDAFVASIRLL